MVSVEVEEIRVGSGCDALALSRTLLYHARNGSLTRLLSIGASATNQAVKSIAIARARALEEGFDMVVRPHFATTMDTQRPGRDGPVPLSRMELEISKEPL